MIYNAKIILYENIDRVSFIKALIESVERYSDFGGIPVVLGIKHRRNEDPYTDLLNVVGLVKSINYNTMDITFEATGIYSDLLELLYKDNTRIKLIPKIIGTENEDTYIVHILTCLTI